MPTIEIPPDCGTAPVFPLPNTVFFPDTVLPLHIFEPRYRAMVRDASAADRRLIVTLLKPGWEADYEGNPAIHEVATLGRIEDLEPLPDGRFNLRLVGLWRVRLEDTLQNRPYRVLRYRTALETQPDPSPAVTAAKMDLLATHGCVLRELLDIPDRVVIDDGATLAQAVNGACANLPIDADLRQHLLEIDDLAARGRQVTGLLDDLLRRLLQFKAMRGGGTNSGEN